MVRLGLQVLVFTWGVWFASLSVVQAETPRPMRPLVWLGVKSFQRLEQRVTETAHLLRMSSMAPVVLGVLNLQWGGFQGLDRQRPIAMVMPTLVPVENPPFVLVLPYVHEPTLRSTLQRLFPQSTGQAERLTLRGQFGQRVGRFDASAKVLLVAPTLTLLHGVEIDLPEDVFAVLEGEESGPDVVLRVDATAAKIRYPAEWNAWLAAMIQGGRQGRDRALAASKTVAETHFVRFAYDVLERRQFQMLHDLDQVEIRISFAPDGWVARLETRWQPQSATAAWVNLQRHATALTPLFSPQRGGIRIAASLRQPDAWRHDMQTLLSLAQRVVESRLAEDRHLTSEQQIAYRTGIHTGFDVAAHMLAGASVEVAAEIPSGQTLAGHALETNMTGWIGLQQSAEHLESLLNIAASFSPTAPVPIGLTRNVAHHHGTPLHRLSPVPGESAASLFLAAEESLLAWHVGPSPVALLQVLDGWRYHTQTSVFPRLRKKMLYLECPISFGFDLLQYTQPEASGDGLDAAAQRFRGVMPPMWLEVTPQSNAATLRWVLPRELLQGVADVLRQHIVQTLRQSLLGY